MLLLVENPRDVLFYTSLFLFVLLVNVSYYIVPVFEIPMYEDSSYFVWLLSMRVDTMTFLVVFYIKTALPKMFKYCLLACSLVVLLSTINILPFENNTIGFYTFTCYLTASFFVMWAFAIASDKIQNKLFTVNTMHSLKESHNQSYISTLEVMKEAVKEGRLTPQEHAEFIKGMIIDLKNDDVFT
jgi:hypothetical protein